MKAHSAGIIKETISLINWAILEKFIDWHHVILDAIVRKNDTEAFDKTRRHLLETFQVYPSGIPEKDLSHIDRRILFELKEDLNSCPKTGLGK
jgi:hypothetical protein